MECYYLDLDSTILTLKTNQKKKTKTSFYYTKKILFTFLLYSILNKYKKFTFKSEKRIYQVHKVY